jgi:uncharacterized DUF497 family protein
MSVSESIRDAEAILPGIPAPEGDEDPRWQAIIAIAEYIETDPEEVWPFVARWGTSTQEDLRVAIATCLLEHMLGYHSKGERFLLMGLSSSLRILVVSHTLPDDDTIRIINAREATRSEKRQYGGRPWK